MIEFAYFALGAALGGLAGFILGYGHGFIEARGQFGGAPRGPRA